MKKALGKGLDALIPKKEDTLIEIEIERILPGTSQPRTGFNEGSLKELAQSIKEKGIIQPIVVSRVGDGTFRIIAGERRWKAAKIAGLEKIPAVIKDVSPREAVEIALIENIQREDLDPVETASAFERLLREFDITQEELSKRVGKDRATIANYLRILKLPEEAREYLKNGSLTVGHAKAILSIEDPQKQLEAAKVVIKKSLSVRQTEELVKRMSKPQAVKANTEIPEIKDLEDKLISELGAKVKILHKGKKGKLEIFYNSLDELDGILQRIFKKSFLDS
ncbi:MAG TPA: ParB/RepB/Spo0J family partition protein [Thermodesulfovibrio thiophilus]|mgnify:FL=1|uniref:ParB/RepB/Spo0J family partition protein n=1 Tax=Thermodesulfovibrio thiophilus TaxID=340095 RepID=UPI0004092D5C|nr:ParB/RepB/Spo0J family partition protein [Thermodesulfovibrio thiophilus]HQA03720.1 ParB/RepB/Spo0J family partition protein [Thermodesulfovibrio thiophilus]HQD35663.1 ParB/RepB/Spo0J family partition protein [Thermodesulfovibrio thiophilus]